MKPVIKYLHNGEYQYATVKDIGDIEKLKTSVKTDLVSAINSVIEHTGGAIPEDFQAIIDELNNEIDRISSGGLNDAQLLQLQDKITEVSAGMQLKIDALKADYETELGLVTSNYDKKVLDINTELEAVKVDVNATEESLRATREELSSVELNVTNVTQSVDSINGELKSKVNSTDFELLESTVNQHETSIEQNKKDIMLRASSESLDLATQRIEEAEAEIKINSEGIKNTVKRNELREELDVLDIYAPNILTGTRDWDKWESNIPSRAYVLSDTYQHTQIQEQNGSGAYLEEILTDLKIGATYMSSIWAKTNGQSVEVDLKIDGVSYTMSNNNDDTFIGADWQRIKVLFVAPSEEVTIAYTAKGATSEEVTHLAGAKVEIGTKNTGWQANEQDVYGKVVSAESVIDQHADQITMIVGEQEKIGEDVSAHTTEINQLSDSIKLQATSLEEIGGEVSKAQASIEVNSRNILSKVEQDDIDKTVEGITLDQSNTILNSDFIRDKEEWTNVHKDFRVTSVNGKNYLSISRTGLSANLVASATSNAFPVKDGDKLSIGLDLTVDDLTKLDVKTVVVLDMYDINDNRVDFKEFTLNEFEGMLKNGEPGRITTRYKVERADVSKAKIRLVLYRNGSLSFTNVSVVKGDIKSVGWTANPSDNQMVQANMKTLIDQNARDISLKAESDTVEKLTGRLETNEAELKIASDKISANIDKLTNIDGVLKENSAQITATAEELKSKVTSTQVDEILDSKKYATQSELIQTSKEITASVSSISGDLENIKKNYMWIAYADDENGKGISRTDSNKDYLGTAYNKETADGSLNPLDYQWSKIRGEETYNVEIYSTKGNVFKNGTIDTWLYANVYRGDEDVTSEIDASRFEWTRTSSDPQGDIKWNETNFGGSKEIRITKDDIYKTATFSCEIRKE